MINIESISKSFGGQILFHDTSIQINTGEKIGLVGRNGHGKTTLLKMLTGKEEPDSGNIQVPGDYRMGYLRQHIEFSKPSILEECMLGLMEQEKDHSWKAEKILSGLGFSISDMQKPPQAFSGGYQVRLNLAKVLVSEPDLLILDEPTNYLDITSIRWISGFLRSWSREILLVTHDRSFMDTIVTHIAGIHRQKIRKIPGNTEKYYEQIALDEEIYEKTRINEEKRRKEMEVFITRFRAKARLAGLVQSRIKALAKMDKKDSLQKIESLEFSFRYLAFSGKQILTCENLSFSYDDIGLGTDLQSVPSSDLIKSLPSTKLETVPSLGVSAVSEPKPKLIKKFNLILSPDDRIAIVGKNGKGKTTLLKLLAEKLEPDSGLIRYNPGVVPGYFEQTNIQSLNPNATVEQEILYSNGDIDRQQARNICGAMMFEGDSALKKIPVLSGGEKSRVMLGKLLAQPLNLLLLDEPTNHLDMTSCDSLVAALYNFKGAVILVTHNEMFLHSLANRLIVFKNDDIFVFEGTYAEFLEKEGWDEQGGTTKNTSSDNRETKYYISNSSCSNADDQSRKISKKEMRKLRSAIVKEKSQLLGPLEKKINACETEIDEYEQNLKKLHYEMQTAAEKQDGNKISRLAREISICQSNIDNLFEKLEADTEILEEHQAIFDAKLENLLKMDHDKETLIYE